MFLQGILANFCIKSLLLECSTRIKSIYNVVHCTRSILKGRCRMSLTAKTRNGTEQNRTEENSLFSPVHGTSTYCLGMHINIY